MQEAAVTVAIEALAAVPVRGSEVPLRGNDSAGGSGTEHGVIGKLSSLSWQDRQ